MLCFSLELMREVSQLMVVDAYPLRVRARIKSRVRVSQLRLLLLTHINGRDFRGNQLTGILPASFWGLSQSYDL